MMIFVWMLRGKLAGWLVGEEGKYYPSCWSCIINLCFPMYEVDEKDFNILSARTLRSGGVGGGEKKREGEYVGYAFIFNVE